MDYSTPGFPVPHHLLEFALVMPSNHLILCHPLLLLSSIFPSIRVFSNESALRIRWPKDWSFSTSPSDEYSGLISFRMDWFALLAVDLPFIVAVQSPSHVRLFGIPWTAARQDSLSLIISWSLPKFTCIESVMPSNHLILCCPLLLLP